MQTVNPSTALRVNGQRSRTIKFYTVGCKVNQYETQAIREQFAKNGFKENSNGKSADIYLINTCTVTHNADRESRRLIYLSHRRNPKAKIIVTGCYAESDGKKLAQIPGVTGVFKNKDKNRIIDLLYGGNNDSTEQRNNKHIGITSFHGHTRAFLKIQDGCNNYCSYCKIPLVRPRLWSKPIDAIIAEAGELVENGYKEIVLCGICLGSYAKECPTTKVSLIEVITQLEKIEGLLRIRLSSIEALDVPDTLIDAIAESQKLCPHLHIPMQSGDDEILRRMNRRYSSADYLNLIKKIKRRVPKIAITTDVLVGFPGEREKNFFNSVSLIKKICPLKTHIFCYSRRSGTAAANFKDEVGPEVVRKRIQHLQRECDDCSTVYKRQFLNNKIDVLIESRVKTKPGFWEGHTNNFIKVLLKSQKKLKNQLIPLTLKKIERDSISADFS